MPKKHQPRVGQGKFGRVSDVADVLVLSKDQMQGMAEAIGGEIGGNGWAVIEPMVAWISYTRDTTGTVDKPTIDWVGHGQWLAATAEAAPSPVQAHQRASNAAQQMYGRKAKGKKDKKCKAAPTSIKAKPEPTVCHSPVALAKIRHAPSVTRLSQITAIGHR